MARKLLYVAIGIAGASGACAQVPDLLNALDAGSASMGMGGSLNVTSSNTFSAYYNPAGLAYIDKATFGAAYRNLPLSHTTASGDFGSPLLSTDGKRGNMALTHAGFVFPVGKPGSHKGVFGLAYTVGGYVNDETLGNNLTSGGLNVTQYQQFLQSKTEYLTAAYAVTNALQTMSFGVALNYVLQSTRVTRSGNFVDSNGNTVTTVPDPAIDDHGHGVSVVIGMQGNPANNPNLSYGLSYRSETSLSGGTNFSGAYTKIPARLLGGVSFRSDNFRKSSDFVVYGLQVESFFKGKASPYFDRSKAQTNFSAGIEYNIARFGGRIPIRLGYSGIQSGGTGFESRNAFTFGLGYRPESARYLIDANFAVPQGGGFDFALSVNVPFGK